MSQTILKGDIRFVSVDWVPAPKCETCGSVMKTVSASHWGCQDQSCDQHKVPVHTGVYGIWPPLDTKKVK